MTRRDISLTIALCASLVLHALLVGSAAEVYSKSGGHIWLPGFGPRENTTNLLVQLVEPEDPMRRLGGDDRGGDAVDPSPGEQPMLSPKASSQGQAFMSLDPEGPGRVGDEPTESMLPLGKPISYASPFVQPSPPTPQPAQQNQSDSQQSAASARQPEDPQADQAMPFGLASAGGDFMRRMAQRVPPPTPAPPADEPKTGPATPDSAPPAPFQAAAAPATPTPPSPESSGTPGAPTAADPAPQGESESDPVTTVGGVEFRRGFTKVRLGRKHKLTRPHLSIAANSELMTRALPIVVLKIKIDPTGKVTNVDIYKSSGSTDVDQPCKLAAYSWWFEPLKDHTGRAKDDVILFTIRFI